ncbi:Hypothetical protein PHPALM_20001 [Phytophthora palmivora]|uniref:Uncharacterized protein n=1 Tax=Phytophthora palmivora TaxID=4796 RepID=A0A2P4XFY6_9STRA|nr:Hypothetical protein PHPALM_20001 [Phytophthora palmivora]
MLGYEFVQFLSTTRGLSVGSLKPRGILKRKSERIKPSLTDENKLKRLEYVLGFIDEDSLRFEPMDNVIHIDEK